MALGDLYITDDDLIAYLGVQGTADDDLIGAANLAATELVVDHCGRDFNQTTTASARIYRADHPFRLHVDDFHTITDLVVKTDDNDDATYETTWATSDFVLEPFNGIEGGVTGFPYRTITAVESRRWPCSSRATVEVTAQWGWAAVPDSVKQATKLLAAEIFRLKDAPLGVAGFNDFGPIRVREVPQVAMLLKRYRHPSRSVVVA